MLVGGWKEGASLIVVGVPRDTVMAVVVNCGMNMNFLV